jgi:hypothetical protein
MKTLYSVLAAMSAIFVFAFAWIFFASAGMTLWATMAVADDALKIRPPSGAARNTYAFTLIAEFEPFGLIPSVLAEGPVITNDGTVVYSAGVPTTGVVSSIFSSNGTVTRLLVGPFEHGFQPLTTSVSGNGMMVTNASREIIDVHDGTVLGRLDPGDKFHLASGPEFFYDVSINNRGSVAFTGGIVELCFGGFGGFLAPNEGVFRFDGETTTTIATFGDPADALLVHLTSPSINERGQVAFLVEDVVNLCPSTVGIEAGHLFVGDGTRLVKIAEANSAPSLNNRGEVGFIGVTGGTLSILVSDGKRTRIVADTNGPFADFPGSDVRIGVGVSINDPGNVVFMAALDDGDLGIFTGPDVVRDKVIATGDPLVGSSVSGIVLSRRSLNNKGQIAFQATLTDGRVVVMRAEPIRLLAKKRDTDMAAR